MNWGKLKSRFGKYCFLGLLILFKINSLPDLLAQPAGMPVFSNSHKQFTISLTGGYFRKNIEGFTHNSPRFLFKTVLGLGRFLDIFGEVGTAKVTLVRPGETNLESKYRLAYGGGINIRFLYFSRSRFSLFFNSQVFRFKSNPSAESEGILGGAKILNVLEFQYDWREVQFNMGFTKRWGNISIYSGANSKLIQRYETKINRVIFAGGNEPDPRLQTNEYLSGFEMNPFLGVDFNLPPRTKFSVELVGRSTSDLVISVGISQTGKP